MHLFDDGWNKMRETIFANQKRLGNHARKRQADRMAEGHAGVWRRKTPHGMLGEKKLFIRQADVYGAYLAYTDHEIGRVIQAVEDLGELDNTLIIYISGDNGASAEGMLNGTPNEFTTFNGVAVPVKDQFLWYPFWGSERTYPHFAAPWAWAFDTPFKWVKQVASHFGGTAQGVAMSWPGHITDVGGIRRQFPHIIDIAPTILEATGIPQPDTIDGIKQRPMDGVSMAYTWDKANANAPTRHKTQYFEMLGNRAIYHDGWVATTTPATIPWELSTKKPPDVITGYKWELYNVKEDPTENNDLAAKMPDKLKEMQDLFYAEAQKNNVLPLDNSSLARWNTPRPSLTAGRKTFTYSGELTGVPASGAPRHSQQGLHHHRRSRDSRRRRGRHDRHPGRALRRLRPVPQQWRTRLRSRPGGVPLQPARPQAHPVGGARTGSGQAHDRVRLQAGGPASARAARACCTVDGKEAARNSMEHSTPITFPEDETFDIGLDTRTPLALLEYRYDVPFKFTGKIDRLTFELGPDQSAEKP